MAATDTKIYHRGEGFGIAAVPGFEGPVVVMDADLVTQLGRIWHAANARVATTFQGQGFDAVRDLCAVLAPVFTHYGEAMVQYGSERPLPPEVRAIEQELEDLRRQLEEFDPDNWPGGRGPGGKGKGKA
jgi:hypothetical protein